MKLCPPKPGLDAHDEHEVQIVQIWEKHFDVRGRFYGYAGFGSCFFDLRDYLRKVCRRLAVYGYKVGSGQPETFHIPLRINNHKMYVHELPACLPDAFQYRKPERDVRYEHSVHDVDVYPLGSRRVYHAGVPV